MDQLESDERSYAAHADDELGTGSAADDDSDAPVRLDANGHQPAGTGAGDVRAENVTLNQGGARDIEATTVSITQGGAAQVRARRADSLTVNEGGSAFAVLSQKATVEDGASVFVLVAGEVNGDARPLLDWRAALALGAGLVIAWRLVRRIL
jgi:hypothetical protein